jgi:hypothetical protein
MPISGTRAYSSQALESFKETHPPRTLNRKVLGAKRWAERKAAKEKAKRDSANTATTKENIAVHDSLADVLAHALGFETLDSKRNSIRDAITTVEADRGRYQHSAEIVAILRKAMTWHTTESADKSIREAMSLIETDDNAEGLI